MSFAIRLFCLICPASALPLSQTEGQESDFEILDGHYTTVPPGGQVSKIRGNQYFAHSESEAARRDGERLGEIGTIGLERLQRGYEGNYRNFNDAKQILQILEAFGGKSTPRKITNAEVRQSGFLHLDEEELNEATRIVERTLTYFVHKFASIIDLGYKRYRSIKPANYENLKIADEIFNLYAQFSGAQYDEDVNVLNSGLLHLTKDELTTARDLVGRLNASKIEN